VFQGRLPCRAMSLLASVGPATPTNSRGAARTNACAELQRVTAGVAELAGEDPRQFGAHSARRDAHDCERGRGRSRRGDAPVGAHEYERRAGLPPAC
jgi:hypothetical protein